MRGSCAAFELSPDTETASNYNDTLKACEHFFSKIRTRHWEVWNFVRVSQTSDGSG